MPLNGTLKNGKNGKCYVHFTAVKEYSWQLFSSLPKLKMIQISIENRTDK